VLTVSGVVRLESLQALAYGSRATAQKQAVFHTVLAKCPST